MMERAEVNRLLGVDSRVVYPDEIKELVPAARRLRPPHLPDPGGALPPARRDHPPRRGGVGLRQGGRPAGRRDPPLHQVTGITRENGRVTGIETNRGAISAGTVISCTSGWSSLRRPTWPGSRCRSPRTSCRPASPSRSSRCCDKIIVSGTLHIYICQSDRGEFVMGSEIEPYSGYSTRAPSGSSRTSRCTWSSSCPCSADARILRQWTGLCDVSPDYAPIMGADRDRRVPGRRRLGHIRLQGLADRRQARWPSSPPPAGRPNLIAPFRLARFYENELVSERGAAAVSH